MTTVDEQHLDLLSAGEHAKQTAVLIAYSLPLGDARLVNHEVADQLKTCLTSQLNAIDTMGLYVTSELKEVAKEVTRKAIELCDYVKSYKLGRIPHDNEALRQLYKDALRTIDVNKMVISVIHPARKPKL